MLSKECSASSMKFIRKKWLQKCLIVLIVFVLLVQIAPLQAFAAWDGSGSTSGDGASQITGDFSALGRYEFTANQFYTNT